MTPDFPDPTLADDDLVALPGWFDAVLKKWDEIGKPEVCYFGLYDDHDWRVPAIASNFWVAIQYQHRNHRCE